MKKNLLLTILFILVVVFVNSQNTIEVNSDDFILNYSTSSSLESMPKELKKSNSDILQENEPEKKLAMKLQWAFKLVNELKIINPNSKIELKVTAGNYDFSEVGTFLNSGFFDTAIMSNYPKINEIEKYLRDNYVFKRYLPKLFIYNNDIHIIGDTDGIVKFYYRDSDSPDKRNARVILMSTADNIGVKIENISFEGNLPEITSEDNMYGKYSDYFRHELRANSDSKTTGLLMIWSYANYPYNTTIVNKCNFNKINLQGIVSLSGLEINDVNFKGSIPRIDNDNEKIKFWEFIEKLRKNISSSLGFNQNGGVLMKQNSHLKAKKCRFSNLIEGVYSNTSVNIQECEFLDVYDHGIYVLNSSVYNSIIKDNIFDYIIGSSIKLGGSIDTGGAKFFNIQGNIFKNNKKSGIFLAGSHNKIHENEFYRSSNGDYYSNNNGYPNIFLSNAGGQGASWFVNTQFNELIYNVKRGSDNSKVKILLREMRDKSKEEYYSIAFNKFKGPEQEVYHTAITTPPAQLVSHGTRLVINQIDECKDCWIGDGVLKMDDAEIKSIKSFKVHNENYVIIKYNHNDELFIIGENGYNKKIKNSRDFKILEIADLNGDGIDEVYSKKNDSTIIYGRNCDNLVSRNYNDLVEWYFYEGSNNIKSHTIRESQGESYFISTFDNDNNIYTSAFRDVNKDVHKCLGSIIYTGDGIDFPNVSDSLKMISADLVGNDDDEIYVSFTNNKILRIAEDRVFVYEGNSSLDYMFASNSSDRNGNKDEIYNKFYTTVYGSSGNLGSESLFYSGNYNLDKFIVADIISDDRQEILTKFNSSPSIFISKVENGIVKALGSQVYNGTCELNDFEVFSYDNEKDRALSVYNCSNYIYVNENLNLNGNHLFKIIFDNNIENGENQLVSELTSSKSQRNKNDLNNQIYDELVKIVPNPSQGKFAIEFNDDNTYKIEKIIIYDLSGNAIFNKEIWRSGLSYEINEKINSGIYIVKLISSDKVITKRIIIK